MIVKFSKQYGFTDCPPFDAQALTLYSDPTKFTMPPTLTMHFTLDRRAGHALDENRFFSQAWLKTRDHLTLLAELEKLF
jgi:hypothetical protein